MLDKPLDRPPAKTDPALLSRFAAIVGDKYAITDPGLQAPYLVELRDLFQATRRWCCGRARSAK